MRKIDIQYPGNKKERSTMKRTYLSIIALVAICAASQVNAGPAYQAFLGAVADAQELESQRKKYGVMSGSYFEAKAEVADKVRQTYKAALRELTLEGNELESQRQRYGVMSGSYFEAKDEIKNKSNELYRNRPRRQRWYDNTAKFGNCAKKTAAEKENADLAEAIGFGGY
jgi:hypothetical protein